MQKILTIANAKTQKSVKLGYLTSGIHFAPANLSGYEVCHFRSKGCAESCLFTAGRGAYPRVKKARISKTIRFKEQTHSFLLQLEKEIKSAIKRAEKLGLTPTFRLNLTSDENWAKIILPSYQKNVFEAFPSVQFYDYTKDKQKVLDNPYKNYHLTFSKAETLWSLRNSWELLAKGHNVAIVFSTKRKEKLPQSHNGFKVIDGDEHDLRFLDKKGVIVGLRAKGKARKDKSGFVVEV